MHRSRSSTGDTSGEGEARSHVIDDAKGMPNAASTSLRYVCSTNVVLAAEPASRASGFLHGVASFDPLPTSVLLWSRVTPSAVGDEVSVNWEVAATHNFDTILQR